MHSQDPVHKFSFLALLLLLFFPTLSLSNPKGNEGALLCGKTRAHNSSALVHNFVTNMETISHQTSAYNWAIEATATSSPAPIYGLFQCYHGLSQTDCLLCFADSRTRLPRCLPSTSARLFLDGCFLRYDNYSFFHEYADRNYDTAKCSAHVAEREEEKTQLAKNVEELVGRLTGMAAEKDELGAHGSREREDVDVYGLAQCWRSLNREECRSCLEKAGRQVRKCLPAREGRALTAGCFLRYSTENFFDEMKLAASTAREEVHSRRHIIVAVSISLASLALLSIIGAYVGYRRVQKMKQESKNLSKLSSSFEKSGLNFKYETLEKATDFFSPSRKLGQGGAGSVYKGILRDGKIIAVKRLFFNTRQWADEFFNEVNLISGIQHKNLVKLLGCSIEGPESLLVYEYVPNRSLDYYLFDKSRTHSLSWEQRFDIIVGTAEGLAYLHEGLTTKIIHRDIKTSNILLDENFKAKIADFGLARCVAADKSHLSTGIAGTLGYMAPEYLVRGQLTEKADVYGFGVLVLEIICGRKNNVFTEESTSVLHSVWMHYKSNTLTESIDECLRDYFPAKVASNVLQVGLLCTQASVSLRPSMSEVVKMLTDKHCTIPLPKQPPFLNSSVMDPNASISTSAPSTASLDTTDSLATSYRGW